MKGKALNPKIHYHQKPEIPHGSSDFTLDLNFKIL